METHQDKERSNHEMATKKFSTSLLNTYVNNIMTGASEVGFSKATVPAETFTYHKLMGPKSSLRVRGVGFGVTSNQLNAKRNCQSRIEPSDSSIMSLLLKEGDDAEENQRSDTPLVGEPIRDNLTTMPTLAKNNEAYIKDAGGASPTLRFPHVLNQVGSHSMSQQRRSAGGKENIQVQMKQNNHSFFIYFFGT
ncbi:hypothetical protein Cgig2_005903 [Carnegiea gigantea]|uniref:Uncharacterized protein n=1 Tax=Carnegiea gigantea TaxID=171969 RepID=A0A9Q1JZY5_9CARY|nr:hypothetical protein Cgig2_005903 [Carnegiea gigantea]